MRDPSSRTTGDESIISLIMTRYGRRRAGSWPASRHIDRWWKFVASLTTCTGVHVRGMRSSEEDMGRREMAEEGGRGGMRNESGSGLGALTFEAASTA